MPGVFKVRSVKATLRSIIISGLILVLVATALFGRFSYSSVCRHCGARQSTTEWQILFTGITLFRHSTYNPTRFSIAAEQYGRTKNQNHDWAFASGGGNFVTCAIGSGRYLWKSTDSDNVLRLLDLAFSADPEFGEALLVAALSPHSAQAVVELAFKLPANAKTPDALRLWRDEHTTEIREAIKPPDPRSG